MSETPEVSYVDRTTIEMDRCECDAPEVRDDTVRYPGGEELDVETCMECGGVRNYRWYDFEGATGTATHHWSDKLVLQLTDAVAIFLGIFAGGILAQSFRTVPEDASISEAFGAVDPAAMVAASVFLLSAFAVKGYAAAKVLGGGDGV